MPNFAELLRVEEAVFAAQLSAIRAAITHPGEKGRGLEQHVAAILRRFLPAEYGIATGFIACARCQESGGHQIELSPQTDVIVYDAIRGSPIVDLGSSQVLPIECVHAAIEVKSSLYRMVDEIYDWSSKIRTLTTRHYLFDPEREVNPQLELRREFAEALAGSVLETSSETLLLDLPRAQMREWMPIRCFALAFEYDNRKAYSLDAARDDLTRAFVDPGHLHAVLVPERCVLWNELANEDASKLGNVAGSEHAPLATFRHRLLDALANFPRPSADATMDLRPYFGGAPG
jgi:hypothetical protein